MSKYTVTRVRHELSPDKTHKDLEGVCVGGTHYTRREVIDSLNLGNVWVTSADGLEATIKVAGQCHRPGCITSPYIKTNPDSSKLDNLENLPAC